MPAAGDRRRPARSGMANTTPCPERKTMKPRSLTRSAR
ncbi:hypothetical protein BURPS406E_R0052 [Burkholderia pseudomallei 406e]|nr:hypothetical protein BURPS406E_R0052 [Burkholderia pseudomallei 406e]